MAVKPGCSAGPPRSPKLVDDDPTMAKLGELGELQCPLSEIAAVMGKRETVVANFLDRYPRARTAYDAGKARGIAALRRAQFKLAQTNAQMAIILGKAYLGQTDRREAADSDAFDVEAAAQRIRTRFAAILESRPAEGDRQRG